MRPPYAGLSVVCTGGLGPCIEQDLPSAALGRGNDFAGGHFVHHAEEDGLVALDQLRGLLE